MGIFYISASESRFIDIKLCESVLYVFNNMSFNFLRILYSATRDICRSVLDLARSNIDLHFVQDPDIFIT